MKQTSWLDATVLDVLPVGITVIDPYGEILYYNPYAAKLLGRTPDNIGRDVRDYHAKPASNEKIDELLAEFRSGREAGHYYSPLAGGRRFFVAITPIRKNGELLGVNHAVCEQAPGWIAED